MYQKTNSIKICKFLRFSEIIVQMKLEHDVLQLILDQPL